MYQLKQAHDELEKQQPQLVAENKRLTEALFDKAKEIDDLNGKRNKLEEQMRTEIDDLTSQIELLKASNQVNSENVFEGAKVFVRMLNSLKFGINQRLQRNKAKLSS